MGRIDQRLCKGEEGFTGSAAGEDLVFWVDGLRRKFEPACEPLCNHTTKLQKAFGGRVLGQTGQMVGQGVLDQVGCWMLWFAHREGDVIEVRRWRQSRLQSGQPLKRVGLETVQKGVHRCNGGKG